MVVPAVVSLAPSAAYAIFSTTPTPLSVTVKAESDSANVRVYERLDLTVRPVGGAAPYANPFDPDEVTLDALLTGPQGQRFTVPGFWSAPYRRQTDPSTGRVDVVPGDGAPGWQVRLVPTAPGLWRVMVRFRDRSRTATSVVYRFRALPAAPGQHGFVQRASGAGRDRYFQRSDKSPYFLVGENVCWSGQRGLADYQDYFQALGAAHANYTRLWMAPRPLETSETGLGRYDLKNAAYFDEVLSLAERHGIFCMLAFGTYGEMIRGGVFGEGKWPANPYNAANGGPVPAENPDAIFSMPAARKAYRNRLRYLVARYASYTGLGFWELWNERAIPADWAAEMAGYLHEIDPYYRPVTTSFQTTGPAEIWNLPAFDLTQTHRYGDEGSLRDIALGLPGDTHAHDVYRKPHLMGEFGINWRGPDTQFDPDGTGTNLHNGLWASALSGAAGGAAIWWWDSYVQPKNLYGTFTGLARFAAVVDWPNRAFEPIDLPVPARRDRIDPTSLARDLVLTPEAIWGARPAEPLTISSSIAAPASAVSRGLVGYLYAPSKPDLQNRQRFAVTLVAACTLRIGVHAVSQKAALRVTIDGAVAATYAFDPTPSGVGTYKSTKSFPEYGGIYQATFDTFREIPIGAGKHLITIENAIGDWLLVDNYTFTGALPADYTPLRTIALQDHAMGETLIWLQDPESNWQSDLQGKAPAAWNDVTLTVPVEKGGAYQVDWWDTRSGTIVRTDHAAPAAGRPATLMLTVPAFRRDISARITLTAPAKGK